jgi:hypothetical protein
MRYSDKFVRLIEWLLYEHDLSTAIFGDVARVRRYRSVFAVRLCTLQRLLFPIPVSYNPDLLKGYLNRY